jgi:hypothetical protein
MGYNTSVISIAWIIWPFLVWTLYEINFSLPFYVSSVISLLLLILALIELK